MVQLELVSVLAISMVCGNISGAFLSEYIPTDFTKILFTGLLLYTSVSLVKSKSNSHDAESHKTSTKNYIIASVVAFFTGIIAGLLGVGGGVILIPMMYLIIGLPLSIARGTTTLMVGFAAAASAAVYFMNDRIDLTIVAPLIVGIIIGGKIGGYLGTKAKPKTVKILFALLMLYTAIMIGKDPIRNLF